MTARAEYGDLVIRGQRFSSAEEAATALGVRVQTVRTAARAHNDTPAAVYQALHKGRLDRLGLLPEYNHARSRPVRIGVCRFPSMRAASLALGFSEYYVSQTLRLGRRSAMERLVGAAMRYAQSSAVEGVSHE